MSADAKDLDAWFAWRGEMGTVHIECVPNADPEFYGCWWPVAEGFPVCTATVEYPATGYRSMLGWVQVVRSTDNESGGDRFELDPFGLFGDAPITLLLVRAAPDSLRRSVAFSPRTP